MRCVHIQCFTHSTIQGAIFIRQDAGDYMEYCWDKTSDEQFEVKEPEAKKRKTEE